MIRQEAAPYQGTTRVLICDDTREHRALVRAVLYEEADVEVVGEAMDGATCLTAIALTHPDVVVLDLQMPGVDGWAVIAALRDMPSPPRVLVFSSATDEAVRARVLATGAEFLAKGSPLEDLVAAVRRLAR